MRIDAMSRPELLYFIDENSIGWIVRCEDQRYGPYLTFHAAMVGAVVEAEAAGQVGFDSMIFMRDQNRVYKPCWVLGEEACLPLPAASGLLS